jgi:multidrug resistance protein, MATE family
MSTTPAITPGSPPVSLHPLREMLAVAGPTVVTMTSYTLMQFVDKLMASRLGSDPIYVGAQGHGGLASFVPISIAMGFITVVNTYVSQNFGAGKPERGPAYVWNAMWLAVLWWIVLIPYGCFMPQMFHALWYDPSNTDPSATADLARLVELSSSYGQPLVYASVFTMASRAIWQYFYGMHRASVVLVAGLTGNIVNFVFNSIAMYGPTPPDVESPLLSWWFSLTASWCQGLGIESHGIAGAAYGTIAGAIVEAAIPMVVFLGPALHKKYATRSGWRPSLPHMKDLFKIGWPGAVMFGNEMFCWGLFMVYFVGHFGPAHSNAGWIAHQWMSMSFMPTVGISIAATAMVGKYMGMKRPDLAARRAWLALGIAIVWMSFMGVMFLVFRRPMVELFMDDRTEPALRKQVLDLGMSFMVATAAFQFFDAIAMTLSGALRGAGDTVVVGVSTVLLAWGLIVGGSWYLVTYHPKLESLGPWIAASSYIIVLSLAVLARFMSGKWKAIKLVDDRPISGH